MVYDISADSDDQISLLYVDDETILLNVTKQYLEHIGDLKVHTASSAKEALQMIQEGNYDAVVSDYQMPEMDGLEFLRTLRAGGNAIPFIIFTGRGREEVAIEALNAGADYYLQKGGMAKVQFGELQNFIRQVVDKNRAEKRLLEHERRMADVINFLPDATFAIDTKGRVIAWNRAIETMTGTTASEMLGRGDYEYSLPFYGRRRPILIDLVLNRDLQKEVSYPVLDCKNSSKFYAEIFIPYLRGGEGAYLWFTASPLYDAGGTIAGAIESIRDITDYKQAEGLYKTVFENTGTAMVILDEDTLISRVNRKTEDILGYSSVDCENTLKWSDLVAEEDREDMLGYQNLKRKNPNLGPNNYECRLIHKNGETREFLLTAAVIPGTKKSIISLIDITGQKDAEKRLKFTQFTADNAPDGILWADSEGRFFSVNHSAIDMFGYPEEELLCMSISDFAPDFPEERFREFWDEAKKRGSLIFEARVIRKNGEIVTIELSIVFLNFEGQDYECGFARDITERKKAGQALYESEKKFREIFNSTSDIIFLNDFTPGEGPGRFIEVNNATCRNLGYTCEELLSMSLKDIEAPETRAKVTDLNLIEQFRTQGKATFEAVAIRKDGTLIPIENNATVFNLNNRLVHLCVGRDISDRKKAENALNTLNKKLSLLSSITMHDISNYTGILLGYEEMLEGEINPEKAKDYLNQIMEATEMIENQIEFTREYQELGLHGPTWQPVESTARSAVLNLHDSPIMIRIDTGKLEIFADLMLKKVFYNLFENAVRHGDHVTELSVTFHEKEGDGIVVIEDNGKGIADHMKEMVFERGVGSNTGFGLFLTRETLEITGISISETGTEGKGARFEITVPKYGYRFGD